MGLARVLLEWPDVLGLLGLLVPEPVVAATNSQVASRVSPDLVDDAGDLLLRCLVVRRDGQADGPARALGVVDDA